MAGAKPLVIIAEDVDGGANGLMFTAKMRNGKQWCAAKLPFPAEIKREYFEDIAATTGATYINEQISIKLSSFKYEYFGTCKNIIVKQGLTQFIGGAGKQEDIEKRIAIIKASLLAPKEDKEVYMLKKRLASLVNGTAVLFVGAYSEAELKEKKDRVDDSIKCTLAALEEGIVAGGGTIGLFINPDGLAGKAEQILYDAIKEPYFQNLKNAGLFETDSQDWGNYGDGVNVLNGVTGNMFDMGIVNSAKVERCAIENAVSVALTLINTDYIIYER